VAKKKKKSKARKPTKKKGRRKKRLADPVREYLRKVNGKLLSEADTALWVLPEKYSRLVAEMYESGAGPTAAANAVLDLMAVGG